ncbi:hypothetical protein JTB14_028830 [Gonioctena quinquepunctata]|nr:hypothetical protein JTB14_028830 [Gonioctena quinquepunctata]
MERHIDQMRSTSGLNENVTFLPMDRSLTPTETETLGVPALRNSLIRRGSTYASQDKIPPPEVAYEPLPMIERKTHVTEDSESGVRTIEGSTAVRRIHLESAETKIFKHLYKLKGTGISITHDLRPEDRELNRNLVHHLKEARAKNQKAHIKNFKLFVNAVPYTIEELENPTDSLNTELESSLPKIQPKNKSAPSTPTTTHHSSKELEDTPSISEIPDVTEPQLKKQTTRTEILKHHIHENTESKSPITTKPSTNNPNRNQPMKMKEIKETRSLRNKQTIN